MKRQGLLKRILCMTIFVLSLMACFGVSAWAREGSFSDDLAAIENNRSGKNWMSGIPDGRYLHEINIPGAHDTCTKNVWAAHTYTGWDSDYAVTQISYIPDLLDKGVRMLDLRFTNCQRDIDNATADDLFLCHGGYKEFAGSEWDALFYCQAASGKILRLETVFNEVGDWLQKNPTETVLLDVSSEFDDSAHNHLADVYTTLKKKLSKYSWLYQSSEIPKLGDVRGKGVILCSHPKNLDNKALDVETINDSQDIKKNGTDFCYENHYEEGPDDKLQVVKKFYEKHNAFLSPELLTSRDQAAMYFVFTSSNHWAFIGGKNPEDIANTVNAALYDNGFFNKTDGRKLGWVYSDFISASTDNNNKPHYAFADYIWKSNYPNYKDENCKKYYYTITYKDAAGNTLGEQYVLKGAAAQLVTYSAVNVSIWEDENHNIYHGNITPQSDLVLTPKKGRNWSEFRDWIATAVTNDDGQGNTISYTLSEDIVASGTDRSIELPNNICLQINLNGNDLVGPAADYVFALTYSKTKLEINGPGSIKGGTVSQGEGEGYPGVIRMENGASCVLNNVKVFGGNSGSSADGAAVTVSPKSTLTLEDAQITGNTGVYGAIYVREQGIVNIGGSTKIYDNTKKNDGGGDLFLQKGAKIHFSKKLSSGARIDFAIEGLSDETMVFTDGYGKLNSRPAADFFNCLNAGYDVLVTNGSDVIEAVASKHEHSLKVDADGDQFKVTCTAEDCPLKKPAVVQIHAPKHSVEGDGKNTKATVTNVVDDLNISAKDFVYWKGTKKLSAPPTKQGTYKVTMTVKYNTSSGSSTTESPAKQETSTTQSETASVTYTIKPRAKSRIGTKAVQDRFLCITKVNHTDSKIILKWNAVPGAEGYDVFPAYYGTRIHGTRIESNPAMTVKSAKATIKKAYKKSSLTKVTAGCIKYCVKAYRTVNGKKKYLASSYYNYTIGAGDKRYSDAKSITLTKSSYSLKTGKTAQIKATVKTRSGKAQVKFTKSLQYRSNNTKVAKVTSKGKITAVDEGTCKIYVTAANGLTKVVTVTVK